MSIEKGKISGIELMFSITALIQGSILFISFTSNITKQDTWFIIIVAFIVMIPFTLIFAHLAKRFPGMNLIQINDIIYGGYLGKVVSTLYIYYFLIILSYNIRDLGDFYTVSIMNETPLIFLLIVFTSICAFAVFKGIEVIARISHLFVVIAFFTILSTFSLLLKSMNFSNFLPILEVSLRKFIQGIHIITAIPLGEIVVFLTIMCSLNDNKHTTRNTMLGLMLGAISFLLIAVRNTAVLGSSDAIAISPSLQATRLIEAGNIFSRMDILIVISQTIMLFFKCSIFYYALLVSLAQLLGLKSYLTLILPIGGISVILAATSWESTAHLLRLQGSVGPIFVTPFVLVFPVLSFLISKIRKLPK